MSDNPSVGPGTDRNEAIAVPLRVTQFLLGIPLFLVHIAATWALLTHFVGGILATVLVFLFGIVLAPAFLILPWYTAWVFETDVSYWLVGSWATFWACGIAATILGQE
ncbi:MAG: hypothetical protein AAF125_06190 [Chloroflexota bacterium]